MSLAFWCVFIAGLLPYAPLFLSAKHNDANYPRLGAQKLEGQPARAYGAHLNAFEAFPFFAAAVIASHVTHGGTTSLTNILAVLFVVARLAHAYFYIGGQQPLRSAAFFAGFLITIVIFIGAAF